MQIGRLLSPAWLIIPLVLAACRPTQAPEAAPTRPTLEAALPTPETPTPGITEATSIPPTPTVEETASPTIQAPPTATPFPDTGEQTNPNWQIQSIDSGIKPAIAVDAAGRPHITYMVESEHGYIKYATFDGNEWQRQIAAEGYFYGPPAIAVSPDGQPHIVWHDHQATDYVPELGDAVKTTVRDGTWFFSTIEHPGHDGWDNSIALDSQGRVHTASIDPSQFGSPEGAEYAFFDRVWQVEALGSGPLVYEFGTSIAINSQDQPAITYFDDRSGSLVYALRTDEDNWSLADVDRESPAGKYSALAFDAESRPHISYFRELSAGSGEVRYASQVGDTWQIEVVDTVNSLKQGPVGARHLTWIRVDGQGIPHIAYNDQQVLKYARRTAGGWQIETIAEAGEFPFGQLVVFDLDAEDTPHLVYSVFLNPNIPTGVIRYAVLSP